MEGWSATLRMKSLLFLSFSAKWISKISISCLLKSLDDVIEEMHSRKLGVMVGGSNWILFLAASKRWMTKRSCTIATHLLNLAGAEGAEIVEMLSGEG